MLFWSRFCSQDTTSLALHEAESLLRMIILTKRRNVYFRHPCFKPENVRINFHKSSEQLVMRFESAPFLKLEMSLFWRKVSELNGDVVLHSYR